MKLSGVLLMACCLSGLFAPKVSAYTFSPQIVTLSPAGSGASRVYRLENGGERPVAVEISINPYRKNPDGQPVDVNEDVSGDFLIYPSQIVLMPRDKRLVQITWIGPPDLSEERAYHVNAREVPIPIEDGKDEDPPKGASIEITILTNYQGILYVTPGKAEPRVVVDSVAVDEKDGARSLVVTCVNRGGRHVSMEAYRLAITPRDPSGKPIPGQTVVLGRGDYKFLATNVLAGGTRRFVIPWPAGLPASPVEVAVVPPPEKTDTE